MIMCVLEGNKFIKVEQNKKQWLVDINGKEIMSKKYDYVWSELGETGLISVTLDGKVGCINSLGEEIIPFMYDDIFFIENSKERDIICVQKGSWSDEESPRWGIMNKRGEEIVPLQEAYPGGYNQSGLILINNNGKYGFVDYDGNVIVPIIYDWASEYGHNDLSIVIKDGEAFIIDKNGKIKFECRNTYERAYQFDDCGLAVVYSEDKGYGAINEASEEVIPCIYQDIRREFSDFGKEYYFNDNNLAIVEKNSKYDAINELGDEIIHLHYDSIITFDNGIVRVEKNGVYGAMNMNGDIILPLEYDWIVGVKKDMQNASSGFYEVRNFGQNIIARKNNKSGLFDENGNEILPCIYASFCEADENGYFVAYLGENNELPVLLTISGKEIISKGYEYIGSFGDDDWIPVSKEGQCSYLDRKGKPKMQLNGKYVRSGKFVRISE